MTTNSDGTTNITVLLSSKHTFSERAKLIVESCFPEIDVASKYIAIAGITTILEHYDRLDYPPYGNRDEQKKIEDGT